MVTSLRPKSGPPRHYHFPKFHDQMLSNGIRLLTAPVEKLPLATVLVIVNAGSVNEPRGKEGIAALTTAGLLEGTARFDGAELAERFEQLGTSLESGSDWDSAVIKITTLSDKLEEAIRLLGEVISSPVFPEREIERLKAERLAEILQLESEPRGLADEKFAEFLYSPESRYARPDEGSAETVSALSRKDVEQFYRSNYRSGATTIIVAGDVVPDEVRETITSAFRTWPAGPAQEQLLTASPRSTRRKLHIVHKPEAPQSELRVGHVGLPRNHPDFFPTLVMNAVLGGLFGSRINLNLREKHGYTYSASSYYDWRRGPGPFVISSAVQSEVTAPALRQILIEIDRIRSEKISDEELSLARDYLEGVFPIRYETTGAISAALATLVIHGLPADYYDTYRRNIHSVSAQGVLEAANAHLHPQELQTVIVGDAATVRRSLADPTFGDLLVHER
jgi:zinc protease